MDPSISSLPEQPVQAIPQQTPPQNNGQNGTFGKKRIIILLSSIGVAMIAVTVFIVVLLLGSNSEDSSGPILPSVTPTEAVPPESTPTPNPGKEVLLEKGVEKIVVPEYFSLRLDNVKQDENCADCLNIVEISLLRDGQDAKTLVFFCGGITGTCGEGQKDGEIEVRITEVLSELSVKVVAYYE